MVNLGLGILGAGTSFISGMIFMSAVCINRRKDLF